jgi:hypothetical protein
MNNFSQLGQPQHSAAMLMLPVPDQLSNSNIPGTDTTGSVLHEGGTSSASENHYMVHSKQWRKSNSVATASHRGDVPQLADTASTSNFLQHHISAKGSKLLQPNA